MKKIFSIRKILIALCAVISVFAFCACNTNRMPVITLDKQNGEALEYFTVPYKNVATYESGAKLFPNPEREGWFFDGWYLDKECTQTAYGVYVTEDVVFYAGWTDTLTLTCSTDAWNITFDKLFEVNASAKLHEQYGEVIYPAITVSVNALGDFTGEKSTDSIEVGIRYEWLSDEMFMGEYVSDEVVAWAFVRATLEKENNYSITDNEIEVTNGNMSGITQSTFSNQHCRAYIQFIFGEPTIQYNHK